MSIRFKTNPTINLTTIKNCSISLARAAFYSVYFTGGLYLFSGKTPEFTTDHYKKLAKFFFTISIGKDIGEWMAPVIVEKFEYYFPPADQPQSPSSIIYSAAP